MRESSCEFSVTAATAASDVCTTGATDKMTATETAVSVVLPNGGGKVKRSSFKYRASAGMQINGGGGSFRGYRAVRVTVPSKFIAEMASKFNAVANNGTPTLELSRKGCRTRVLTRKQAEVRGTVESSAVEKASRGNRVGTDMFQKHVDAATTDAAKERSSSPAPLSIVKLRLEQFQNGSKTVPNPKSLGPKPKLISPKPVVEREGRRTLMKQTTTAHGNLLNKHKRLSIARDPDAQLESVLNATSPASPVPPSKQQPVETERPPTPPKQQPKETERTSSLSPSPLPQSEIRPNRSFLHDRKRLQQTTEVGDECAAKRSDAEAVERPVYLPLPKLPSTNLTSRNLPSPKSPSPQSPSPQSPSPQLPSPQLPSRNLPSPNAPRSLLPLTDDGERRESFSHLCDSNADDGLHDYNYIEDCGEPQAIYEELWDVRRSAADPSPLPDVVLDSSYYDGVDQHQYTTIYGGEQNIYDDVDAVKQETRKRSAEEDGSYETVEAPPTPPPHVDPVTVIVLPPTPPPHVDPVTAVVSSPATPSPPPVLTVDDDDDGRSGKRKPTDSLVDVDNSLYDTNSSTKSNASGKAMYTVYVGQCDVSSTDSFVSGASVGRNSETDLGEECKITLNEQDIMILQQTKNGVSNWAKEVQNNLANYYISISSQSVISFINDVPVQLNYKKNPCDFLSEQLLSVVLKTVFLEEKFESQELSLFFDNEIDQITNTKNSHDTSEDEYFTDDSFDDEDEDEEKVNPCIDKNLPASPDQQKIFGLIPVVKRRVRRQIKKRWTFTSLIRNLSRTLKIDFGNKVYEGTSIGKQFDELNKGHNFGSSNFYIAVPIYSNIDNNQIFVPVDNASTPPSSIDSQCTITAPPSLTPDKRHSIGNNSCDTLLPTICDSSGRHSFLAESNATSMSENGSNQDLYRRFADEPLYQYYAAGLTERSKSVFAGDIMEECDGYEEISSITSRPTALELITPCPTGHGQNRSLWCEVPEVKNSGIIDTLSSRERKLQEAKFELFTSEASYFKSLTILENHFVESHSMKDDTILSKINRQILFGNVSLVRKCSEKLLAEIENCWQGDILLTKICEILGKHSEQKHFDIYVRYCSNQIYQDRTLKSLKDENYKFNEALKRLEMDPKCQSLSLHSFLMLPMQRITRFPLLVHAILLLMDPMENSYEYNICKSTLDLLNKIVQKCNETTREIERKVEMLTLGQQLKFPSDIKRMSLASSSRWLVRSGSMNLLPNLDGRLTLSRKLIPHTKLYFFLFNDMFFVTKQSKNKEYYTIVDYCARNFVEIIDASDISPSYKNLLKLVILENHESKTVEMLLSCDSESSKKRWIQAMLPPISSNPEEKIYNEWDCPQVFAEHAYTAVQPDELSLQKGDIVKVLTKMNDDWYHGERIRDGEIGWFPSNYTLEIASQHARAKNLKQRYHVLNMTENYLQSQQDKIKKK